MKKILGIVVLMIVMAVSALAISDTATVPVYLNVPAFVRLSVNDSDGQFDLVFNPATPASTVADTVALLAEANVNYSINHSVTPVSGFESWANLVNISIDTSVSGYGTPGNVTFNTTASINVLNNLSLGTVPAGTKIADVVFTISSL
ncbi:hypothetical protein [Petrotoga sp. 9PWA.NaAc.5.4]|uniref:hypothetical protein n=1 Tax=Petrotoga sp. 9PWA.NaAc.5.4 TaxID=1434328 RepID=UPI000CA6E225|nr:hypothetical protein [Petrotoga sp. 9PWA.NaAc.5.4]PNR92587.1 hypothetical protein X924_09925 [Petrotoga sp. 9PWA.NaAc.5.4]